MATNTVIALISAGSALFGAIAGPLIRSILDNKRAETQELATDIRQQGQIYSNHRAEALTNMAEASTVVKMDLDSYYYVAQQAPEEGEPSELNEKLSPSVQNYFTSYGRFSAFVSDEKILEQFEEFGEHVQGMNEYLHQSFDQGTPNPSNAPVIDTDSVTNSYEQCMDHLREELRAPINDWNRRDSDGT